MGELESAMSNKWSSVRRDIEALFDRSVLPTLQEYVKIPNVSPAFDKDFASNGLQERAMELLSAWVKSLGVKGMTCEVMSEKGRTPLLFVEVAATTPSSSGETILMYAHMDKQPPVTETWAAGLHPYKPVVRDGKLYGRGAADDGYGLFAALAPIFVLQQHNIPHPRIVITIEGAEESGGHDVDHYYKQLVDQKKFGDVRLIVILDSFILDYKRVWLTTSLRGMVTGNLTVKILNDGVHSGGGGGIVPDSFRIARQLLNRIEAPKSGKIRLQQLHTKVPPAIVKGLKELNGLSTKLCEPYPFVRGAIPECFATNYHAAMHNWWSPCLAVTGADGLPPTAQAGNVLRPMTKLKLSVRIPPHVDSGRAAQLLKETLERRPPYNAQVTYECESTAMGWHSAPLQPWLGGLLQECSQELFKESCHEMGGGCSIPLLVELEKMFPSAQLVVTGVLGPESNAHGPNEFLHIDYCKKLMCVVGKVAAKQAQVLSQKAHL